MLSLAIVGIKYYRGFYILRWLNLFNLKGYFTPIDPKILFCLPNIEPEDKNSLLRLNNNFTNINMSLCDLGTNNNNVSPTLLLNKTKHHSM